MLEILLLHEDYTVTTMLLIHFHDHAESD